jgi:hypothetical protein
MLSMRCWFRKPSIINETLIRRRNSDGRGKVEKGSSRLGTREECDSARDVKAGEGGEGEAKEGMRGVHGLLLGNITASGFGLHNNKTFTALHCVNEGDLRHRLRDL